MDQTTDKIEEGVWVAHEEVEQYLLHLASTLGNLSTHIEKTIEALSDHVKDQKEGDTNED
jgi:hypothetical protein